MRAVSDAQRHITAFWTMVAPGYEAHGGNVPAFDSPLYHTWVDEIDAIVPSPPTDVLDLATGTGFLALILAALGHRVTAVDLSADMLGLASDTAGERGLTIRFLFDDAVAPAFEPTSFDVITSRHLLWTLRDPDRALNAWRELLRPGGLLVAFDGFWFDPRPGPHDDEPEPFRRHYTAETRAELPFMHLDRADPIVATVERAGFQDVEVRSLPDLADRPDGATPYGVTARRAMA
jgi:SAM-dependent methyltransferase